MANLKTARGGQYAAVHGQHYAYVMTCVYTEQRSGKPQIDKTGNEWFIVWPTLIGPKTAEKKMNNTICPAPAS